MDRFLAKCQNECNSLIPLQTPDLAEYPSFDLSMVDESTFYVTTARLDHTIIYKSTDGGGTWVPVFDSLDTYFKFLKMFDKNDGIALGSPYSSILTDNGGATWKSGHNPLLTESAVGAYGDSIICMGVNEGYCVSNNRGKTWECNSFRQSSPRRFFFLNRDTLFATSSGPDGIIYGTRRLLGKA